MLFTEVITSARKFQNSMISQTAQSVKKTATPTNVICTLTHTGIYTRTHAHKHAIHVRV